MKIKSKSALNGLLGKVSGRQIIELSSSDINPSLEVIRLGNKIVLNSSNANYSFGGLHTVFQRVFKKLRISERAIKDVLVLGFGAGSIPSIMQEELGMYCNFTAVEVDPEVIRLGRSYFNIDRFDRLQLLEADAATFMRENIQCFDLIVVDVYIDFEVPESCETTNFVTDLRRSINPGGMILFNKLVYNYEAKLSARELMAKFKALDGETRMIKVKQNLVNRIIVFETRNTKHENRKTK
ncbi:MAG: fused MFS/spermidine synthase [Bacteroidales bacterium]|jgi:spermidine synthase|nr:fused MFS/spermidine synthase [Bacteroidales bacterium]